MKEVEKELQRIEEEHAKLEGGIHVVPGAAKRCRICFLVRNLRSACELLADNAKSYDRVCADFRQQLVAKDAESARLTTRRFPIQNGPTVPWEVMAPHEARSQANHYQSLEKIASRGGFGADEAYCIVNNLDCREMEKTIGWAEAKRRWQEYAEKINAGYGQVGQLKAEIATLREALEGLLRQAKAGYLDRHVIWRRAIAKAEEALAAQGEKEKP